MSVHVRRTRETLSCRNALRHECWTEKVCETLGSVDSELSRWLLQFDMDWRICCAAPQHLAEIDLQGRVRCILPRASTGREV